MTSNSSECKVHVTNHWVYNLLCVKAKFSTGQVTTHDTIGWTNVVFGTQTSWFLSVAQQTHLDTLLFCTVSFLKFKGRWYFTVNMEGRKFRNIKSNKEVVFVSSFPPSSGNSSYKEISPKLIHHVNMYAFSFLLLNPKKISMRCSLFSRHLFCEWKNTGKSYIFAEILCIRCFLKFCSFLITALWA